MLTINYCYRVPEEPRNAHARRALAEDVAGDITLTAPEAAYAVKDVRRWHDLGNQALPGVQADDLEVA